MVIILVGWARTGFTRDGTEEDREFIDLEEEMLEEDDFPDLVPASESGGIIDELAFLEDSGVVELAARHSQKIGMSPSAITVLTREDIRTSGARTIPGLLRRVPGMDVIQVTPFNQAIGARLEWNFENNTFLVLVDGREVNVELLGQPFWEMINFLIEDIERIEVIRGPGSSLYGANALAGVVSITTRKPPERSRAWARLTGGELGTAAVSGRVDTRFDRLRLSLSGGVDRTGMMRDLRELGKLIYRLRSLAEFQFREDRRLSLEAGIATGQGLLPTGLGVMDSVFIVAPLHLTWKSPSFFGRIMFTPFFVRGSVDVPLSYLGVELAKFDLGELPGQFLDAEIQWTLPEIHRDLMLIGGVRFRLSRITGKKLLDAETYADPTSPRYHQAGLSRVEIRSGVYLHAEWTPARWVTVTTGSRLDVNTVSGMFFSPRLALVFQPITSQYLRLGAARAFRMPAFYETSLHPPVLFPKDGPLQGGDQELFREFTTRVLGNADLDEVKVTAFEAGYRGEFLDGRLSFSLDLYANLLQDSIEYETLIRMGTMGLPDLESSRYRAFNDSAVDRFVLGGELSVRYEPTSRLAFSASWAHREVWYHKTWEADDSNPKNLITLGGRFRTESGLLGSLFVHSRSDFIRRGLVNPYGFLEPGLTVKLEPFGLIVGKLGWCWEASDAKLQAGVQLFLPVAPFGDHPFRYHEYPGGTTPQGVRWGGDQLQRMLTFYLEGRL